MAKKVAVILLGCGWQDGSEIREAVLSYLALEEEGHTHHTFSLDQEREEIVNHQTSKLEGSRRNILTESARISRGGIQHLSTLNIDDYDVLWIPGGCGVFKDQKMEIPYPEVIDVIKKFHDKKKPIVAVCIAPALIGIALKGKRVKLTLGCGEEGSQILKNLGALEQKCKADEISVDQENRIYTTPGYMEPPDLVAIRRGVSQIAKQI